MPAEPVKVAGITSYTQQGQLEEYVHAHPFEVLVFPNGRVYGRANPEFEDGHNHVVDSYLKPGSNQVATFDNPVRGGEPHVHLITIPEGILQSVAQDNRPYRYNIWD